MSVMTDIARRATETSDDQARRALALRSVLQDQIDLAYGRYRMRSAEDYRESSLTNDEIRAEIACAVSERGCTDSLTVANAYTLIELLGKEVLALRAQLAERAA